MIKLELRRAVEGTHFAICVCGEQTGRQIVIPLSQQLSDQIARMLMAEGVGVAQLILPKTPVRCS